MSNKGNPADRLCLPLIFSLARIDMEENKTEFEVADHYFLDKRGGFVTGIILSGIIKIGMIVIIPHTKQFLTISGIEYLDNCSKKEFKNALIFKEKPEIEFVKKVFPRGTVIKIENC